MGFACVATVTPDTLEKAASADNTHPREFTKSLIRKLARWGCEDKSFSRTFSKLIQKGLAHLPGPSALSMRRFLGLHFQRFCAVLDVEHHAVFRPNRRAWLDQADSPAVDAKVVVLHFRKPKLGHRIR